MEHAIREAESGHYGCWEGKVTSSLMCVWGVFGVEGVKAGGIREGFMKDVTFEQGLKILRI